MNYIPQDKFDSLRKFFAKHQLSLDQADAIRVRLWLDSESKDTIDNLVPLLEDDIENFRARAKASGFGVFGTMFPSNKDMNWRIKDLIVEARAYSNAADPNLNSDPILTADLVDLCRKSAQRYRKAENDGASNACRLQDEYGSLRSRFNKRVGFLWRTRNLNELACCYKANPELTEIELKYNHGIGSQDLDDLRGRAA